MQEPGLLLRLYYPTEPASGHPPSPLYPPAKWLSHPHYIEAYSKFMVLNDEDFLSSPYDPNHNPLTQAAYGAPLIKPSSIDKLPVIVFSHGLGGCRMVYSTTCIDVASHGLLVAAVEHKDQSACISLARVPGGPWVPRGKYSDYIDQWIPYKDFEFEKEFKFRNDQVNIRSSEVSQSLDVLQVLNDGGPVRDMLGEGLYDFSQFGGRLDMAAAGVMGHSFGGATTITALAKDERFKCGITLDVWMFPVHKSILETKISQPLIFINSYIFSKWTENVNKLSKLLKPPNEKGISDCSLLTLKGSVHTSQCDVPFAVPNITHKYQSKLDKHIIFRANSDIVMSFIKRYLIKDHVHRGHVPILDGLGMSPESGSGIGLVESMKHIMYTSNEMSSRL
jgi:platelet-activating factor acetylhydrolase